MASNFYLICINLAISKTVMREDSCQSCSLFACLMFWCLRIQCGGAVYLPCNITWCNCLTTIYVTYNDCVEGLARPQRQLLIVSGVTSIVLCSIIDITRLYLFTLFLGGGLLVVHGSKNSPRPARPKVNDELRLIQCKKDN